MTSTSDTNVSTSPTTADKRPGLPWWVAIIGAALAATVVNLVVYAIGASADASFVVPQPGAAPQTITVGGVIFSSIVPLSVGSGLAVLLGLRWPVMLRVAQVVGAALALLSAVAPLMSEADGATRVSLATMHVVVGVAVVAGLEAIRRRRIAR